MSPYQNDIRPGEPGSYEHATSVIKDKLRGVLYSQEGDPRVPGRYQERWRDESGNTWIIRNGSCRDHRVTWSFTPPD